MMTKYRYMCRIRVEKLSKFITWMSIMGILIISHYYQLDGYLVGIVSTCLWFWMPDLVAYILEAIYKVGHRHDTYR